MDSSVEDVTINGSSSEISPLIISSVSEKWNKATKEYLRKKKVIHSKLAGIRALLILLLLICGMILGLLFPRKLQVDLHTHSNWPPDFTNDTSLIQFNINVTANVYNPNLFEIDVLYFYADFYYGPLWIGNKDIPNFNMRLPSLGKNNVSFPIDMEVNVTEIITDVSDPTYQHILIILINSLTGNMADGDVTITIDSKIKIKAIGLLIDVEETFVEGVSWASDIPRPFTKRPFLNYHHPAMRLLDSATSPIENTVSRDQNNRIKSPLKSQNSISLDTIPVWFLINFGSLCIVFLFIGIAAFVWKLLDHYYNKQLKVLGDIKQKAHLHMSRLDLKPSAVPKSKYDIGFHSLGLVVGSNTILESVSGSFASGRITAIMGPSGCGKTSMLSVLSGRANYGKTTGTVFINGEKSQISKFKKVVGFVPQEDIMIRILKVEEILDFSSRTRVSSTYTNETCEELVEEVIELLSLENIRDSIIGDEDVRGISGGQRKRVNIAMELVANPGMIFLDEPTSGLDSTSSIEVIQVLKKLAHHAGLTIVAVIHQPRYEIFEMFDDIALLGVGGRPVYLGKTDKVNDYFHSLGYDCPARINPADYYMDVIAGLHGVPQEVPNEIVTSSWDDYTTCQKLQAIWEFHYKNSDQYADLDIKNLPNSENITEAAITPLEEQTSMFELTTIANSPDFLICFFMCAVFPWCLILFNIECWPKKTPNAQFGGIFGTICAFIWFNALLLYFGREEYYLVEWGVILISLSFLALFICLMIYFLYMSKKKKREPTFMKLFLLGILYLPFAIPIILFLFQRNRKFSAALAAGSLFLILLAVVVIPILIFENKSSDNILLSRFVVGNVAFFIFARLLTYIYRYLNIPIGERQTRGVLYQTYMAAYREFIVQARNWKELLFHIIQCTFGGLFLGFCFYNRSYKGPALSVISPDCPVDSTQYELLTTLCTFLHIPTDDPILAISSLSSLTIAMCAVSYSNSVFGKEKTVFQRETRTGTCTGAYYVGKTLAQIPITLFASACFLLSISGLAVLKADWGLHYIIVTLTYATFTGVGYTISLITPQRVSQLAGIFFVLVCMMFSGGQPTLAQLEGNALLGEALYYPTYISYTRWVNELVYITEIKQYGVPPLTMNLLYGYDLGDEILCWCTMVSILVFFRTLGYIALVIKE